MRSLIAATRPTLRDIRRHPQRILAAVLLVLGAVAAVAYHGIIGDASDAIEERAQPPHSMRYYAPTETADPTTAGTLPDDQPIAEAVREALGPDHMLTPVVQGDVTLATDTREETLRFLQLPADDPYTPAPGEALLSVSARYDLNADIDSTLPLKTPAGAKELTVSGIAPAQYTIVAAPEVIDPHRITPAQLSAINGEISWVLPATETLTQDEYSALTDLGFMPHGIEAEEPVDRASGTGGDYFSVSDILTGIAAFISIAVLLVLLSPAFGPTVSRQTKAYALMAAQGARPGDIRLAVAAYGLCAGIIGATVGVALGFILARVDWAVNYPNVPLEFSGPKLAALWLTGIIGCVLTALVPAWLAGRADIARGIHGGANDRMLHFRWWMLIGPGLIVLGLLGLMAPEIVHVNDSPINPAAASIRHVDSDSFFVRELLQVATMLGVLCGIVGVALTAPLVVLAISRISAPLAPRLALRDIGRQALKSAPAVAAIAIITASTVYVLGTSAAQNDAFTHRSAAVFTTNSLTVTKSNAPGAPAADRTDEAIDLISEHLGPVHSERLIGAETPDATTVDGIKVSPETPIFPDYDEWLRTGRDPIPATSSLVGRQDTTGLPALTVATPLLLEGLQIDPGFAERECVLVPDYAEAPGGRADFGLTAADTPWGTTVGDGEFISDPVSLPVCAVLPAESHAILPTRQAARALGLRPTALPQTLVIANDPIRQSEMAAINQDINRRTSVTASANAPVFDERLWPGYLAAAGGVAVVVAVVLILAAPTTRRHNRQLIAVGAVESTVRNINAWFAGLLAFVGSALGIIAGHVAGFLLAEPSVVVPDGTWLDWGSRDFWGFDWKLALAVCVLAPAVCAAAAWVFTPRARGGSRRES